jgi:Spy/CpxP family protein refolding chaperone
MKRIWSCFVLSFFFLFVASQLSYAEAGAHGNKMEKDFPDESAFSMKPPPCPMEQMQGIPEFGHPFPMHIRGLNLDEKQMAALKEIENSVLKELIRKKADVQIAEIELQELLDKDIVDLKAVEAKLKQIAVLKTETQLIVIQSVEKMKAKLTARQRETLKKMRPMAHPMNHHMRGKIMPEDAQAPPLSPEEKGE